MRTLLQINVVANSGSTGRIAEEIGRLAISKGWKSYIAYGRGEPQSKSELIRIGSDLDMLCHGVETRLFDNHGLASRHATRAFIKKIELIKPDIIHLHNIHGYYLNYKILFQYLSQLNIPIVWTLHDCWAFTGHCSHFMYAKCERWEKGCYHCSLRNDYPSSVLFDRCKQNYIDKKKSFSSLENLTIIPVSDWLDGVLKRSFLNVYPIHRIYNGINVLDFRYTSDVEQTKEHYDIKEKYVILGVANNWGMRKGFEDFLKLRNMLSSEFSIVLVGLSKKQMMGLPHGICGISRTNSTKELSSIYSMANVYVNLTLEDNFPTTNLEAMACGTPVVTYDTGGSGESVSEETGTIIEQGNIQGVKSAVTTICAKNKKSYLLVCRERVIKHYNKDDRFKEYTELYDGLI